MHRAFAECAGGDAAFAPEPITADDMTEWRDALRQSGDDMLVRLERGRSALPEGVRDLADAVVAARQRLANATQVLAPDGVVAVKTRYHGDLHLGQVLAVQNDFHVIDFEGEPARPLAARRLKGSPLRDVAGMIRSFEYAATAAVRQIAETRPQALGRVSQVADTWRQHAVDGFRAAYRKEMRGCAAYPVNKLHAKGLIDFFTLEKAIYEVTYELANRPDWVGIPLNGILRILAKTKDIGDAAPA